MDGEQPKQPRNPNDLIVFQNIDNEDHEWQFDAIKTPLPYFIAAGEVRELPFFIARHGIEKLIDKMLQKQNKLHTNPILRDELRNRIVLGLKSINHTREKTANELVLEAMQRKKDTDPYEELFKSREVLAEQQRKQAEAAATPPAPIYTTTAQPVQPIAPQVSNPTNPVVPTATALNDIEAPVAAIDPERQNVYNLLRTKLHLDLTHVATKENLDAMPLEQLKQEFASQLPELANPSAALVPDNTETLAQDGMPLTDKGTPALPEAPVVATVSAAPPAPQIPMNPTANAAPLLDQQLGIK